MFALLIEFTKAFLKRLYDFQLKESPDLRLAPPHFLGRPKRGSLPKLRYPQFYRHSSTPIEGRRKTTEENERAAEDEAIGDSSSPDEWSASGALLPKSEDD